MRAFLSIALLLILWLPVTGQLRLTSKAKTRVLGITGNVEVYQDSGVILVDPARDAQLTGKPVGKVVLETSPTSERLVVKCTDLQREPVPFSELARTVIGGKLTITYLLSTPGRQWFSVTDHDVDQQAEIVVTVGESEAPDDGFDNIGRRVSGWVFALALNPEIAAIYREVAQKLRADEDWPDIAEAGREITHRVEGLDGYEPDQYERFRTGIDADLKARWNVKELSRAELADYWEAIARGLEA